MKYLISFLCLLMMVACHSSKQVAVSPPVTLEQSENIRYERIVETVYDTVPVVIPIPEQSFEVVRFDSISHLETDFAESDAWINADGSLGHNIKSKPPNKTVNVPVASTNTTETKDKEVITEVPVPYPEPYPVEKELTTWQKIKIGTFWYLIAAILAALGWIFRKPLISALRKCF